MDGFCAGYFACCLVISNTTLKIIRIAIDSGIYVPYNMYGSKGYELANKVQYQTGSKFGHLLLRKLLSKNVRCYEENNKQSYLT